MTKLMDSVNNSDDKIGGEYPLDTLISRSDAEIVNKWIPSVGRMTQLMDSLSSSEDRIGGFPQ